MPSSTDRRALAGLSLGHAANDVSQGALPAILVYLKPELDLSYTMVAGVVVAGTVAISLVQPAFGHLSDRRGALWLMPAGTVIGGTAMALAVLSPLYVPLLLLVALSGVGVGAFHPESARLVAHAGGAARATATAVYQVGGNAGFAVGPVIAAAAIGAWGLHGGLVLMVPGFAGAVLLVVQRARYKHLVSGRRSLRRHAAGQADLRAFWLLQAVVVLRSVAYYGLFTFVPLWEVANGASKAEGTQILTLVLAGGVVGTLIVGPLADRIGRRPLLLASLAAAVPLMLVYVLVGGVVGIVAVTLAGGAIVGSFGVTLVMSQEFLPGREATAAGLSVGLAIGLGGVAAILLGAVADAIDLRTALLVTVAGPALGVFLGLGLPRSGRASLADPAAARAAL
jgi:FSR family fosmidomycin resistance protein-like MFS transporter